jgi:hypothetical protein
MARRNPWLRLSMDAWTLGLEASAVMGIRTLKIAAGGPAATSEAERMVTEKIEAGLSLQTKAMTGALGATPHGAAARTMAHYRRKVRANRRRLTRETLLGPWGVEPGP